MRSTTARFALTGAGVAEACARVEEFLAAQRFSARETKRLRLTVETLLRRVGERMGRQTECELTLRRRLGRAEVRIRYAGAEYDPTTAFRENEGNIWSEKLLAELGLVPEWSRRRGVNCLTLRPRFCERLAWLLQLAAIACAALLSLLPDAARLEAWALAPLRTLLDSLWSILGAPLVFFSAVAVVCGVADTLLLGKRARRMLGRFAGLTLLWAALGTAAFALLPLAGGAMREGWAARLWGALRAVVPADPLSPFLTADIPQLLFLALVTGLALALLGGRTARVREWAEQCAYLARALTEAICRLTPLALLCALPRLFRCGALARAWRPLALFAVLVLAMAALKLLLVCASRRESPARLLGALLPLAGAAFRCGCADAAFGAVLDGCENDLRVPHERLLLGLPTGNVLCAPLGALCAPAALTCLALAGDLPADALSLAAYALLGVLLTVTLPHTPGARLLGLWLLLRGMASSAEGFALLAAACVLFDALCSALSGVYLSLELLRQSDIADAEAEK